MRLFLFYIQHTKPETRFGGSVDNVNADEGIRNLKRESETKMIAIQGADKIVRVGKNFVDAVTGNVMDTLTIGDKVFNFTFAIDSFSMRKIAEHLINERS